MCEARKYSFLALVLLFAFAPSTTSTCNNRRVVTPPNMISLEEKLVHLKEETLVDKKQTSANKMRLMSANDPRPSSRYIGVATTAVMATVICLIVLPDVVTCIVAIWKYIRPGQAAENSIQVP